MTPEREANSKLETINLKLILEAMKGVEPLSSGLQDRRSIIQLSYIAKVLVELRGVEPLRPACKAGIIPLDHSPQRFGRGGGIRTRTLSFMRRTLFSSLSYSAKSKEEG